MNPTIETPDQPRPKRLALLPGLLRRERAARYCGVGESTWDRLTAAGRTPAPIRLGGSVGWSRRELARWIEHGCPARAEWEPVWQALRVNRPGARPR